MQTVLHRAETRGHANHGWLDSHHTFSFADYITPNACTSAYSACSMTTWWLLPVASAAFAAGESAVPRFAACRSRICATSTGFWTVVN